MRLDDMRPDELERLREVEAGGTHVAKMGRDHVLIVWAKATGHYLRIDRKTPWGNPFRIGKDGDRDEVCDKYADYLRQSSQLMARLPEAEAKVLGCHCYPERCHGGEIIKALSEQKGGHHV